MHGRVLARKLGTPHLSTRSCQRKRPFIYAHADCQSLSHTRKRNRAIEHADKFMRIKKYVDDNFWDPTFSLGHVSETFSYSKKYLSVAFKQHFKVGFSEYLSMLRIHHACVLMEQDYTGVGDIAFLCGFDDPLYFSRVFKKQMKLSPKTYIKQLKK